MSEYFALSLDPSQNNKKIQFLTDENSWWYRLQLDQDITRNKDNMLFT